MTREQIEQKAKAYDEALERAKNYCEGHHTDVNPQAAMEYVFPELKESEDERIRKSLINFLKSPFVYGNITVKKTTPWIAWLEKQGEQGTQHLYDVIIALWDLLDKIDTFADLQIDDTSRHNPFRKIEDITRERHKFVKSDGYNLYIKGEKITDFQEQNIMMFNSTKESKCEENDSSTACLENQSKYKPEPKFKVGDWIINSKGTIARVNDVKKDIYGTLRYNIEFSDGNKSDPMPCFVDEKYHLWTIKDARDGDVLVSGDIIFIFNLIHGVWLNCYCSLHKDGSFNDGDYDLMTNRYFDKVHPATKEQRDLLFQKMKEAGYEWDAEKKELKKIKQ